MRRVDGRRGVGGDDAGALTCELSFDNRTRMPTRRPGRGPAPAAGGAVRRAFVPALLVGRLCIAGRARAAAATECATLPTPIYVTGSTAAKPLLAEIGKFMAAQSPPVTVVYLGQGSCAGVDAILSGTPLVSRDDGAQATGTAPASS